MMKHVLVNLVMIYIWSNYVWSQSDTMSMVYRNLDTLKTYSVRLESSFSNGVQVYKVNGVETGKHSYEQFKKQQNNIKICTPCYLMSYNEKNILISEGEQYQDCIVGVWKEYYPNGRVKVQGQCKRNNTADWKSLWDRLLCSRKEGEWIYYNLNGGILKREMYNDNELVE